MERLDKLNDLSISLMWHYAKYYNRFSLETGYDSFDETALEYYTRYKNKGGKLRIERLEELLNERKEKKV